jgi:hypothetical protein
LHEKEDQALYRARTLLRASQLRNFDRIAHRLSAAGRDVEGLYEKLNAARRDALQAAPGVR